MSKREVTKEQLEGIIRDLVQSVLGMTPEQAQEMRKTVALLDEKSREERRSNIQEGILGDARSRAYVQKAERVIRFDKHKGLGLRAARYVRCLLAAKKSGDTPENIAMAWGDNWLAEEIVEARKAHTKALAAGVAADGGALIPETMAAEIIELLRAKAVVRMAGVPTIDMPKGTLNLGRQSGAATAAYVGESTNATYSQLTTDEIQLAQKKLIALTAVSNDLLRAVSPTADRLVRDDLIRVMALREDLAFIRGDGTANTPKGFRNKIVTGNVDAATQAGAAATVAEITGDTARAARRVEEDNVDLTDPFWIMHTRSKWYLMSLRDGNNNLVWANEMRGGTFMGFRFFVSNQIPINLGGGTNESEVYFVEPSMWVIGDAKDVGLDVSDTAAYDEGGTMRSTFSRDETAFRAISEHDIAPRHPEGGAIISTVKWGA